MSARYLLPAAVVAAGLAFGPGGARAANYVMVDLSSYVDTSFGNAIGASGGTPYPTGTGSLGSNLTGVPFNIANNGTPDNNGYGLNFWGGWPGGATDNGTTLAITGLNIANAGTAYTLINTTFGCATCQPDGGPDFPTTVVFKTATDSATFVLYEGQQLRDYNNGIYTNTITSPTAEWWNNGGDPQTVGAVQRLDQQTYDLSGLTGGNILEVDVSSNLVVDQCVGDPLSPDFYCTGPAIGGETTIFSGLTFLAPSTDTGVPEPASIALLTAGLAGLGLARRRRG